MNLSREARTELLRPFLLHPLPQNTVEQIGTYVDLLQKWNSRINLTSIRDESELIVRHFGESFFLAQHLFPHLDSSSPDAPIRVVDVGSGAGFPAVPVKMWNRGIHLTMIEANHKKAAFLREAIRALGLEKTDVVTERAADVAKRSESRGADVVSFRAVELFEEILGISVTLLAPGGTLAILVGANQVAVGKRHPNIDWDNPISLPLSDSRVLFSGKKLA